MIGFTVTFTYPNSVGSFNGCGMRRRLSLSVIVACAQKLAMDREMVFPKNPSEGFPMRPTRAYARILMGWWLHSWAA